MIGAPPFRISSVQKTSANTLVYIKKIFCHLYITYTDYKAFVKMFNSARRSRVADDNDESDGHKINKCVDRLFARVREIRCT